MMVSHKCWSCSRRITQGWKEHHTAHTATATPTHLHAKYALSIALVCRLSRLRALRSRIITPSRLSMRTRDSVCDAWVCYNSVM